LNMEVLKSLCLTAVMCVILSWGLRRLEMVRFCCPNHWFAINNRFKITRMLDCDSKSESNCWSCVWSEIWIQSVTASHVSDEERHLFNENEMRAICNSCIDNLIADFTDFSTDHWTLKNDVLESIVFLQRLFLVLQLSRADIAESIAHSFRRWLKQDSSFIGFARPSNKTDLGLWKISMQSMFLLLMESFPYPPKSWIHTAQSRFSDQWPFRNAGQRFSGMIWPDKPVNSFPFFHKSHSGQWRPSPGASPWWRSPQQCLDPLS
jgi:hypothetical protein